MPMTTNDLSELFQLLKASLCLMSQNITYITYYVTYRYYITKKVSHA